MKDNKKKSRYLVLYTLILIVIFVAIFAINQASNNNEEISRKTKESPSISSQPVLGDRNAKVSIVEFGDYKCPSCKAWGEQVWPKLKADYVDTGKASFSYINVLFHGAESKLGAMASESVLISNPDDFWKFHEALFDAQPAANHDNLWITEERLLEIAESSVPGINKDEFVKSLMSSELEKLVDQDQQLVADFSIKQTPTIMINNNVIENPFDYNAIAAVIEQELKK